MQASVDGPSQVWLVVVALHCIALHRTAHTWAGWRVDASTICDTATWAASHMSSIKASNFSRLFHASFYIVFYSKLSIDD